MKQQYGAFILLVLLEVITGCSIENQNFNAISISTTLIGKGNLFGNSAENIDKQNMVIRDTATWNQLLDKMNTANTVSNTFTETDIDFDNFTVIAVFDAVQPNGGHSIDITSIIEFETTIFVKIENLQQGDATSVITQPYHIVKISKGDKPIAFG